MNGLGCEWESVEAVLIQRLLRCTRVTEDAFRFAFRHRDLTGAEQVHGDTSVEIVQLGEFQCPCFLGRNVRLNKLTIRGGRSVCVTPTSSSILQKE